MGLLWSPSDVFECTVDRATSPVANCGCTANILRPKSRDFNRYLSASSTTPLQVHKTPDLLLFLPWLQKTSRTRKASAKAKKTTPTASGTPQTSKRSQHEHENSSRNTAASHQSESILTFSSSYDSICPTQVPAEVLLAIPFKRIDPTVGRNVAFKIWPYPCLDFNHHLLLSTPNTPRPRLLLRARPAQTHLRWRLPLPTPRFRYAARLRRYGVRFIPRSRQMARGAFQVRGYLCAGGGFGVEET